MLYPQLADLLNLHGEIASKYCSSSSGAPRRPTSFYSSEYLFHVLLYLGHANKLPIHNHSITHCHSSERSGCSAMTPRTRARSSWGPGYTRGHAMKERTTNQKCHMTSSRCRPLPAAILKWAEFQNGGRKWSGYETMHSLVPSPLSVAIFNWATHVVLNPRLQNCRDASGH